MQPQENPPRQATRQRAARPGESGPAQEESVPHVLCYRAGGRWETSVHLSDDAAEAYLAATVRRRDQASGAPVIPDGLAVRQVIEAYFARHPEETYVVAQTTALIPSAGPARIPGQRGTAVTVEGPGQGRQAFAVTGDRTLTVLADGQPVLGVDAHGPGYWRGDSWHRLRLARGTYGRRPMGADPPEL